MKNSSYPQRFENAQKVVFGSVTRSPFNNIQSFVTTMPYSEILKSCSLDVVPAHIKFKYKEIQRVAGRQRKYGFEDYCFQHLTQSLAFGGVIPPVLIGCMHKINLQMSKDIRSNDYLVIEPDSCFVIDGMNRISTAAEVIGGYRSAFVTTSRDTPTRIKRREEMRQKLADLEIPVVFIFRADLKPLSEDHFSQLFADVNSQQHPIRLNQVLRLQKSDIVVDFAHRVSQLPEIKNHGGVSLRGERVNSSSRHFLTLCSLTRFVLGAIGGFKMQSKLKGARELPNGEILNQSHIDAIEPNVMLFLRIWISEQGHSLYKDKTGFQFVSTLFQALGLVFYEIHQTCAHYSLSDMTNNLQLTAKALARIDYSRTAEHWKSCKCVGLNESGEYVVISGGATCRKLFARHLCAQLRMSSVTTL